MFTAGPGGAAIFIEVTTDNAKRTVADIRHLFTRFDGKLGTTGSVAHLFERRGQINVPAGKHEEDATLEAALDAGALDVVKEGEAYVVTTQPHDFHAVQEALVEYLPRRALLRQQGSRDLLCLGGIAFLDRF